MTHSMRYQTVQNMLESGRGQELYEAHEKIYKMLTGQDKEDIHQAVRKTYFSDAAFESKK